MRDPTVFGLSSTVCRRHDNCRPDCPFDFKLELVLEHAPTAQPIKKERDWSTASSSRLTTEETAKKNLIGRKFCGLLSAYFKRF